MSFTWFAAKPLRTREQIAREVHAVSLARGLDELASVICLMTVSTEVGADDDDGNRQWWCPINRKDPTSVPWPHDSESDDGFSSGYLQQQLSGPGVTPAWGWGGKWGDAEGGRKRMTLATAADMFLAALPDDYGRAANNPALAGQFAQRVQKSAFPDRYAEKWDEAWAVLRRALSDQPPTTTPEVPVADNRPDFNEFPIWSPSSSVRSGKPTMFLIHTQEGGGGNSAAEDLANYLANPANQVSYHYTISQASDGGVTVVDCIDTDDAAWSVGNANSQSINLCFAGSRASWTRDQWLKQSKAIDVAAYLAVQDAKKYGFSTLVVPPPYSAGKPGISDHQWVTKVFGWGTHTDVGPNFPWDVFAAAVAKYATGTTDPAPVGPTPIPREDADLQLVTRFKCLGDRTLVEAVGAIGAKLGIEGCYDTKAQK